MDENEREFIAYSRKLLRRLEEIKKGLLEEGREAAVILLDELIEETKSDIND